MGVKKEVTKLYDRLSEQYVRVIFKHFKIDELIAVITGGLEHWPKRSP